MGRPLLEVEDEVLWDMANQGYDRKEQAEMLDVSLPTMSRLIGRLQKEQGLIMQYRAIQSLQLTALQARVLENITAEKIAEAPLRDLVIAFKILKDKELVVDGKPSEIKGLVAYLIHLEKEKIAGEIPVDAEIFDAEVIEITRQFTAEDEDYVPEL